MFRKTLITALIVMVSVGTVLAKAPLDGPVRRSDTGSLRILGQQTAPKQTLRFKASRPVTLRTAEIERLRHVVIG